eukprot:GHVN01002353.1.p1 GENE.GHVN01002353.1~~GHVN01002353.1.p1  ORF type:complete len:1288 (-),score=73.80 GHVN01002353.1:159-4022(-)
MERYLVESYKRLRALSIITDDDNAELWSIDSLRTTVLLLNSTDINLVMKGIRRLGLMLPGFDFGNFGNTLTFDKLVKLDNEIIHRVLKDRVSSDFDWLPEEETRSGFRLNLLRHVPRAFWPLTDARLSLANDDWGQYQACFTLLMEACCPQPDTFRMVVDATNWFALTRDEMRSEIKEWCGRLAKENRIRSTPLSTTELAYFTCLYYASGRGWSTDAKADVAMRTDTSRDNLYAVYDWRKQEYSHEQYLERIRAGCTDIWCRILPLMVTERSVSFEDWIRYERVSAAPGGSARDERLTVHSDMKFDDYLEELSHLQSVLQIDLNDLDSVEKLSAATLYVGVDKRRKKLLNERNYRNVRPFHNFDELEKLNLRDKCQMSVILDGLHYCPKDWLEQQGVWSRVKLPWAKQLEVCRDWSESSLARAAEVIRISKRMLAEMKPAEWFAFPSPPRTIAVIFQKGECGNARGISSVDTHTTFIGKYVMEGFDKRMHLIPGGDAGADAFKEVSNKLVRRSLMKAATVMKVTLCYDWASFQDYHVVKAMMLHYSTYEEVLTYVRNAPPEVRASKLRAVRWVKEALLNRKIVVGDEVFDVLVSLLSGDPDTNGLNSRFNIIESQGAVGTGEMVAGLLDEIIKDDSRDNIPLTTRKRAFSRGDDFWVTVIGVLIAFGAYVDLAATGRPANKLKQVVVLWLNRFAFLNVDTDYLRCRETAIEARGQFARALGPLLNSAWESCPKQDIIPKVRVMYEGMIKLLRRGGRRNAISAISKSHEQWWCNGIWDSRLDVKYLPIVECCNGPGCALHPLQVSWDHLSKSAPELKAEAKAAGDSAPSRGLPDQVFHNEWMRNHPALGKHMVAILHRDIFRGEPTRTEKEQAFRRYASAVKDWHDSVVRTERRTEYMDFGLQELHNGRLALVKARLGWTIALKLNGTGHQFYEKPGASEPDQSFLVEGDRLLEHGMREVVKRRKHILDFDADVGQLSAEQIVKAVLMILGYAVKMGLHPTRVICFSCPPGYMAVVANKLLQTTELVKWVYIVVPQPREAAQFRKSEATGLTVVYPSPLVRINRTTWPGEARLRSYSDGYENYLNRMTQLEDRITQVGHLADVDRIGPALMRVPSDWISGGILKDVNRLSSMVSRVFNLCVSGSEITEDVTRKGMRFSQFMPTGSYDVAAKLAELLELDILTTMELVLREDGRLQQAEELGMMRRNIGDERTMAFEQGFANLPLSALSMMGPKTASCVRRCTQYVLYEVHAALVEYSVQQMRELFVGIILISAMRIAFDSKTSTLELD